MSSVHTKEPSWPPKSPHEALLCSPSGRKKLERRRDGDSPSPSPILRPSARRPGSRGRSTPGDEDEDEDEETLELQLRAIEARLKLKRLQQAKARQAAGADSDSGSMRSRPGTSASLCRVDLPRPQSALQVPVSPVHNRRTQTDPKSPARVILGIDKGIRAQDVSLKRAASFHARNTSSRDTLNSTTRPALHRTTGTAPTADIETSAPRGKSFSERIAESRMNDKERQEKQARIEKSRSHGFGLNPRDFDISRGGSGAHTTLSLSSGTSMSGNTESRAMPPPSKTSALQPLQKSRSLASQETISTSRSSSTLSTRSEASHAPSLSSFSSQSSSSTIRNTKDQDSTSKESHDSLPNDTDSGTEPTTIFEPFSGFHLSKRLIEHGTLTRTLESKDLYNIPKLLRTVKSPDYDPPDVENDYVVLGIIASKSSPLKPKNARRTNSTGDADVDSHGPDKFMVLKLTDFKWEIDLFLFDTGFSTFWKLTVGTVIAVLNPDIMPPRNRDIGQFSLKLSSSEDTVLEIGMARDLGFCKAMKKDGKECGSWVDARKTHYCAFHVELQVERSKRGRMEVNTMTGFGKGPGSRVRGGYGMFGGRGGVGTGRDKDDGLTRQGMFHDKYLHETVYIAPGGRSAAQLLDNDGMFERGFSRAELHRKRLAEKEKERELAKKLGELGNGIGGQYMKLKGADTPNLPASGDTIGNEASTTNQDKANDIGEEALGLLGRKAGDVTLSPVKRKRGTGGKGAASEPMGWSGAFKRGLLSPKKKERESSPAKKRARFMLDKKGIREPGRDSLGGLDVGLLAAMDDDDDDDLDIIQ